MSVFFYMYKAERLFITQQLCAALNVNKKSVDRDLDVYRNLLSKLVQAKELLKEYVDRWKYPLWKGLEWDPSFLCFHFQISDCSIFILAFVSHDSHASPLHLNVREKKKLEERAATQNANEAVKKMLGGAPVWWTMHFRLLHHGRCVMLVLDVKLLYN